MEKQEIIEKIVEGLNYYLDTLAIPPHMEKYSDEMCSWTKAKEGFEYGPGGVYNINFGNISEDDVKQAIRVCLDKGAPHWWFVNTLSTPANLRTILKSMKQNLIEDYGMAIPPENIDFTRSLLKNENPEIRVKRLENKDDFDVWASIINTAIFNVPLIDPVFYFPLCENGTIKCFLGFYNETPVSTSCTFINGNGVGRLEFIATLSDYRKKGMGKAVCCAGIEQLLNDGAFIVTLTAREMGVSLYESLGFKIYY